MWLRAAPHLYLTLLLLGVVVAKNGSGIYPAHTALYDIAVNWNSPSSVTYLGTQQDYLVSNGLVAWLAGAFQLTDPVLYSAWHAALLLATMSLALLLPQVRESRDKSLLTLSLLITMAAPAVLITWREGYDTLLVAGLILGALTRRPWLMGVGWLLAALNHPTLTALAVVVWGIVCVSAQEGSLKSKLIHSRKPLTMAVTAVGVGALANATIVRAAYGETTSRVDYFVFEGWDTYLQQFADSWWLAAFGVLGVGWFILIDRTALRYSSTRALLVLSAGLAIPMPLLALDPTRVASIALLPAVLWWINVNPQMNDRGARILWQRWLLPALLMPTLIVWEGALIIPWMS